MKFTKIFGRLFLTLSLFSSIFFTQNLVAEKTQDEIVAKLGEISHSIKYFKSIKESPVGSSVLANLKAPSDLYMASKGFLSLIVKNADGFDREMWIKRGTEKRKWFVFVGGVGSPATIKSLAKFIVPFADSHDAGIAIIESSSSARWSIRNDALQASGYEAGWDLYLTLKALKEHEEVAPYMSELNLIGFSLGGSDSAFVAGIDGLLGTNVVDGSFLAWSSPADRLTTMQTLLSTNKGLGGSLVNLLVKKVYVEAAHVYQKFSPKPLTEYVLQANVTGLFQDIYMKSSLAYFGKRSQHFDATYSGLKIVGFDSLDDFKDPKTYSKLFMLDKLLPHVKRPFLWIHSKDDPLVPYKETAGYLHSAELPVNMKLMTTEKGGHLGYPVAYGKGWVREVMTQYFKYWSVLDENSPDQSQ